MFEKMIIAASCLRELGVSACWGKNIDTYFSCFNGSLLALSRWSRDRINNLLKSFPSLFCWFSFFPRLLRNRTVQDNQGIYFSTAGNFLESQGKENL